MVFSTLPLTTTWAAVGTADAVLVGLGVGFGVLAGLRVFVGLGVGVGVEAAALRVGVGVDRGAGVVSGSGAGSPETAGASGAGSGAGVAAGDAGVPGAGASSRAASVAGTEAAGLGEADAIARSAGSGGRPAAHAAPAITATTMAAATTITTRSLFMTLSGEAATADALRQRTVTLQVAVLPLLVRTVTVTLPLRTPVTRPVRSTVATLGLELLQETVDVAPEGHSRAVRRAPAPTETAFVFGRVTRVALTARVTTLTVKLATCLPLVAVITAVPGFFAATVPV